MKQICTFLFFIFISFYSHGQVEENILFAPSKNNSGITLNSIKPNKYQKSDEIVNNIVAVEIRSENATKEYFDYYDNPNALRIRATDLSKLPKDIWDSDKIKYVWLNLDKTGVIPIEFVNLVNLEILEISSRLPNVSIPDSFSKFKKLRALTLDINNCTEMPSVIFEIKTLKYLSIYGRALVNFPNELKNLDNLDTLYLKVSTIKETSGKIIEMPHLQSLTIYGGENFYQQPDWVNNSKSLKFLEFGIEGLDSFPEKLYQLENLETLSIKSSKIKNFPKGISKLENLKTLILKISQLEEFPYEIAQMKNLENLDIQKNIFSKYELPSSFKLPYIQELKVYGKMLNLSPFSNLTDLTIKLYLDDEYKIDNFDFLDNSPTLKKLKIENAKINIFPMEILNLKMLEELDLAENQIASIPREIIELKKLQKLNLYNNKITEIPEYFFQFPSLNYLNLKKNVISIEDYKRLKTMARYRVDAL